MIRITIASLTPLVNLIIIKYIVDCSYPGIISFSLYSKLTSRKLNEFYKRIQNKWVIPNKKISYNNNTEHM